MRSVTFFHVFNPLPPVLREHGGSEDPGREEQLGRQFRKDRNTWEQGAHWSHERKNTSKTPRDCSPTLPFLRGTT